MVRGSLSLAGLRFDDSNIAVTPCSLHQYARDNPVIASEDFDYPTVEQLDLVTPFFGV